MQTGIGVAYGVLERLKAAQALTPCGVLVVEAPQPERELKEIYVIDAKRVKSLDKVLLPQPYRSGRLRWLSAHLNSLHHAERLKATAKAILAAEIAVARQPDKIERVVDILAAISEDLGDAEL
jgi:hypothetical protein